MARAAVAGPDAMLLPKVETRRAGRSAPPSGSMRHGAPERTRLWAMMETPRGILNAAAIAAAHPRLEGFVLGTNDLAKDLGAAHTPDRLPLRHQPRRSACSPPAPRGSSASTASTTPSRTPRGCAPSASRAATWASTARR